jgi:hypothetical protein
MQSHDNTAKAAISVRNPQAPILDREARFAAGEGATTLGDHPFSLIACIRVSGASNAGKLEVGSHSLFAPACPGNGFLLREWGYCGPGKLGSEMPTANEAGPNLQRTIPFARCSKNGLRPSAWVGAPDQAPLYFYLHIYIILLSSVRFIPNSQKKSPREPPKMKIVKKESHNKASSLSLVPYLSLVGPVPYRLRVSELRFLKFRLISRIYRPKMVRGRIIVRP